MYQKRIKDSNLIIDFEKLDYYEEYTGFSSYLPRGFFTDLINFIVHKQFSNKDFTIKDDEITKFLFSIPDFVFKLYNSEKNIICKALYVLKYISNTTNLMSLENNNLEESDYYTNCVSNLSFTITSDITNNYVLNNTKLLNTLHSLLSDGDKLTNNIERKTLGYKNPLAMKHSLLARPDFAYQLTQKSSHDNVIDDKNNKKIFFIEDVSTSMSIGHNKDAADLVKFLLYQMDYPVWHLVKKASKVLTTREEKLKAFSTTEYFDTIYDYDHIFNGISRDFKNQKIVLLNDGQDFMPNNLKLNNQLFVLNTGVTNKNAQGLCRLNKGQQIKI